MKRRVDILLTIALAFFLGCVLLCSCALVNTYSQSARSIQQLDESDAIYCWSPLAAKDLACKNTEAKPIVQACIKSLTAATGAIHSRKVSRQGLVSCMAEHGWQLHEEMHIVY
jgi:hypothetical protein